MQQNLKLYFLHFISVFIYIVCNISHIVYADENNSFSLNINKNNLNRLNYIENNLNHTKISKKINDVVIKALHLIGIRYKWGGNTPDIGLDCSGLVKYVFECTLHYKLPRRAQDMSKVGKKIYSKKLQIGDLVFFKTRQRSFSHVGIYIGNHKFIHSPSTGQVIRIDNLLNNYWSLRYNGARRIDIT